MMNSDVTRSIASSTIASLMECAQQANRYGRRLVGQDHHVIALSSGTGAGGREVGGILAKHLSVKLYDKEIVEAIAREAHFNKHVLELLDERIDGLRGAWLHSILTGENLCKENYCRNLVNVILGLACQGGVILGRGCCFILAQYPVLRVNIVGSLDKCATRFAEQEGIAPDVAKEQVKETDDARDAYIKKLFDQDNNDPRHFDLVVNSDHLSSEYIADLILRAKEHAQFEEKPYPDDHPAR
uniref:Cytidylate kinase n=2 Tax=Candidatus Kentrum sp. SD TaxID=2126332 RepID=A0A450Y6A1_9GAMM|nr:MAG: Cytidylate kinase [Candidatus Kentron sp. SD]